MNEAIRSLKALERSHDIGAELFRPDLFLSKFLNSLLVRAKLLEDLGSVEEKILAEARDAIATFSIEHDKQAAYWKSKAWIEAYRIEMLLLLAEPPARLIPE